MRTGWRSTVPRETWTVALSAWVFSRLAVGLGYAAARAIANHADTSTLSTHVDEGLVTWDGTFYLDILENGYRTGGDLLAHDDPIRFFPLYPMVSRLVSFITFGHPEFALVFVANVASLATLVLLARLVEDVTGDERLARRSMWWLAVFPAAGIMVMAYAESLMIALSLWALISLRRGRYPVAALAAFGASLTRPVGVLLTVPFALEVWNARRTTGRRRMPAALATVLAPAAGTLSYLLWVGGQFGDWMAPVDVQREIRGEFQDPFTRLWDAVDLTLSGNYDDAPNLAFALLFIVLLVPMARRLPLSWTAYAATTLVVTLSAENIDSIGRYGLVAFPFVVTLASLADREVTERSAMSLSTAGLSTLCTLTWLGIYLP